MPSAWSLVSFFLVYVAGFTQLAAAQRMQILSPGTGTALRPGQSYPAVLQMESTTSSVNTIAIAFGLNARGSNPSSSVALGKIALQAFSKDDLKIDRNDLKYRIQLTLPPASEFPDSSPHAYYDLVMAQYYLLGATQSPMLFINSTSVVIAK